VYALYRATKSNSKAAWDCRITKASAPSMPSCGF
jgi:hypothetical protein